MWGRMSEEAGNTHDETTVAMEVPRVLRAAKLGGYDFFRHVLGSPKYVVAPMVDQVRYKYKM